MSNETRFDSIEDGIKAIARGEMVICVDDEDRENEGDLICAAEKITPEMVNFMAVENLFHLEGRVMTANGRTGNTMGRVHTFLVRESGKETSMKGNIRMGKEKDKEHTLSLTGKSIQAVSKMAKCMAKEFLLHLAGIAMKVNGKMGST